MIESSFSDDLDFCNLEVEETNASTNLTDNYTPLKTQFPDDQGLRVSVLSETSDDSGIWLTESFSSLNTSNNGFSQDQVSPNKFSSEGQQHALFASEKYPTSVDAPTYLPQGMQWQQTNEAVPSSSSSHTVLETQPQSTSSVGENGVIVYPPYPWANIYPNVNTKGDTDERDQEMYLEQMRKAMKKKKRQEKNKECSKRFRLNKKVQEQTLKKGKNEKAQRLISLRNQINKMVRQFSQITQLNLGCHKGREIAAIALKSELFGISPALM